MLVLLRAGGGWRGAALQLLVLSYLLAFRNYQFDVWNAGAMLQRPRGDVYLREWAEGLAELIKFKLLGFVFLLTPFCFVLWFGKQNVQSFFVLSTIRELESIITKLTQRKHLCWNKNKCKNTHPKNVPRMMCFHGHSCHHMRPLPANQHTRACAQLGLVLHIEEPAARCVRRRLSLVTNGPSCVRHISHSVSFVAHEGNKARPLLEAINNGVSAYPFFLLNGQSRPNYADGTCNVYPERAWTCLWAGFFLFSWPFFGANFLKWQRQSLQPAQQWLIYLY